ncbi:hypothetical protein WA026_004837 [Henosepilachna vigintioctopunctata]|uniref:Uncharacterized protein n=1 Tax=Henosepilachna vigintioctopunctata TaxID=420089 RepID=A0AAW1USY5_9CUCU
MHEKTAAAEAMTVLLPIFKRILLKPKECQYYCQYAREHFCSRSNDSIVVNIKENTSETEGITVLLPICTRTLLQPKQ